MTAISKTFLNKLNLSKSMETVTLSKVKFKSMKEELELQKKEIKTLKNGKLYRLYQRLLEFEQNIAKGKKYTRKDLGF